MKRSTLTLIGCLALCLTAAVALAGEVPPAQQERNP